MTTKAIAAVLSDQHGPFELREVELEEPRPDEVLVRIEACGICHTDLEAMTLLAHPCVLGHEGVGVVERVGGASGEIAEGDRVLVSYPSCGACRPCRDGRPFHCDHWMPICLGGQRLDGSRPVRLDGQPIASAYFQQSSFATHALAPARNLVRIDRDLPVPVAAALPCGVQTGAGAILNTLQARRGEGMAVFGVGAVGLSAVMAGRAIGLDPVIAVDVHPARLELARELGASHTIDVRDAEAEARLRSAAGPGVECILDTSGRDSALRQAMSILASGGRLGLVTVPDWDLDYRLSIQPLFERVGSLVSVIQGSSIPRRFLPELIERHRAGQFPINRLVRTYPFADINRAIEDARSGRTIKPVLVMP